MFDPKDPKWTTQNLCKFNLAELAMISILIADEYTRHKDPTTYQLLLRVQVEVGRYADLPEFKRLVSYVLGTDKKGLKA